MKKKFLMTATVPSMIGQFNMENIKILLNMGYEVDVACNFKDRSVWTDEKEVTFEKQLSELHVRKIQIEYARSPYHVLKLIKSYLELKALIQREGYSGLHCHTPVAAAVARLAANRSGTGTKVIYTAHGFHFYKGAPLHNWLIYYPIEKWLSKYTDVLITINKEDYQRAKKKFHAKKTEYIPGVGIDIDKIQTVKVDWTAKRRELGIAERDFVLLSVGELNKNKNHEVIIRTLAKLKNPEIKYIICGKGPLKDYLEKLAVQLGVREQLILLGFRTDIIEIYKIADIFVFPSRREGLSVALMEAMSCGLPCVVSKIRGNIDLINPERSGKVIPFNCVNSWKDAIEHLLTCQQKNKGFMAYSIRKVKPFSAKEIDKEMKIIYSKI